MTWWGYQERQLLLINLSDSSHWTQHERIGEWEKYYESTSENRIPHSGFEIRSLLKIFQQFGGQIEILNHVNHEIIFVINFLTSDLLVQVGFKLSYSTLFSCCNLDWICETVGNRERNKGPTSPSGFHQPIWTPNPDQREKPDGGSWGRLSCHQYGWEICLDKSTADFKRDFFLS